MKLTLTSRPPGPWDANTAPAAAPIFGRNRHVDRRSAPSGAAFGDLNQGARNAAARADAEASHAEQNRWAR